MFCRSVNCIWFVLWVRWVKQATSPKQLLVVVFLYVFTRQLLHQSWMGEGGRGYSYTSSLKGSCKGLGLGFQAWMMKGLVWYFYRFHDIRFLDRYLQKCNYGVIAFKTQHSAVIRLTHEFIDLNSICLSSLSLISFAIFSFSFYNEVRTKPWS